MSVSMSVWVGAWVPVRVRICVYGDVRVGFGCVYICVGVREYGRTVFGCTSRYGYECAY